MLKPLGTRILIEKDVIESVTKSGLVLPDNAKEKPVTGTVVAVGSGKILDNGTKVPVEVEVGNKVLFGKFSGTEVKVDNKEYWLLNESDILAVIVKEEK